MKLGKRKLDKFTRAKGQFIQSTLIVVDDEGKQKKIKRNTFVSHEPIPDDFLGVEFDAEFRAPALEDDEDND